MHFDRKGTIVGERFYTDLKLAHFITILRSHMIIACNSGAEIKTYLLEKARVVQQTAGERNYHVFYQVRVYLERFCVMFALSSIDLQQVCCASAGQKMLQDLRVEGSASDHFQISDSFLDSMAVIADASVFNYTKTCLVANNNDDTKSFDRTKQAMSDIHPFKDSAG